MSNDAEKPAPPDCKRINMNERYEVHYWSEKFGVSEEELQKAVDAFGPRADDVERRIRNIARGPNVR